MKYNLHTHTTWCDGKDSPEAVIESAIAKEFDAIGFSSHTMMPTEEEKWTLGAERLPGYIAEIRALAAKYAGKIRVLCGIEADFVKGGSSPDRGVFAAYDLDYIIGSIHFVVAEDGTLVPVDHTPELLKDGIVAHFGGSVEKYIRTYFAQEREMVTKCDFDIMGHPDLVRKFNVKHPYFDESADWYRGELEATADAIAASGKTVEINTGAISRGWRDDAYPSDFFRSLLKSRGVKFILSSDAHSAATIDCAFDRYVADTQSNLPLCPAAPAKRTPAAGAQAPNLV